MVLPCKNVWVGTKLANHKESTHYLIRTIEDQGFGCEWVFMCGSGYECTNTTLGPPGANICQKCLELLEEGLEMGRR